MRYDTAQSDDGSEYDLDIEPGELRNASGSPATAIVEAVAETATGPSPIATEISQGREKQVRWKDLPRKKQLAIITMARLSEPITQTSLQAYLFYQLKWFDPTLPDSTISSQSGVLHASFTAAQFFTAMLWGRASEKLGRKQVIMIGLMGTCLSCLGIGFSTKFWQALLFRTLGGALNGNVGVLRTMISEIIREKKYQSRAFLILPMTFNIGVVIGPVLGGVLSDPAGSYPDLFGNVDFFRKFPYALPNLLSFVFLFGAAVGVWLGLEETLEDKKYEPDIGLAIGKKLAALLRGRLSPHDEAQYAQIPETDSEMAELGVIKRSSKRFTQRLPFRRIFTRNVVLTQITQFFLNFHTGTFNALWFVFLSTPVYDPATSENKTRLPFHFTGGVGLQPKAVGTSLAILGFIGISMQILLFPRISGRLGTLKSLRIFLLFFPIAYYVIPYLAVVPSTSSPPSPKTGPAIWAAIVGVLFLQVTGRTFALPSQIILLNNSSPHPSVLGTVHGLGQSASSAARTIGPMLGGWIYGYGLNKGFVGLEWWILGVDAICCWLMSLLVKEGDGHEIWLEGDDEDEA